MKSELIASQQLATLMVLHLQSLLISLMNLMSSSDKPDRPHNAESTDAQSYGFV